MPSPVSAQVLGSGVVESEVKVTSAKANIGGWKLLLLMVPSEPVATLVTNSITWLVALAVKVNDSTSQGVDELRRLCMYVLEDALPSKASVLKAGAAVWLMQ